VKAAVARSSWVELQALGPDLANGLRGAVATVVPLILSIHLARPELLWVAFGGWLATLTDPGGSRGRRGRVLAAFVLIGACLVWAGQLLASWPVSAVAGLAAIAGAASLLRVFGPATGGLGTTLSIVAAISTALPSSDARVHALWFAAGGSIAILLSSILWPVWIHLPVRQTVARTYEELAAYTDAIAASVAGGHAAEEQWTRLARHHPRRIRDAIEQARAMSLAVRARRSGESVMGSNLRVLLGLGEAQFLLLVTLASELERLRAPPPGTLEILQRLSRSYNEVRAVLVAPAWRTPRAETALSDVPPEREGPARLLTLLDRDSARSIAIVGALGTERSPELAGVVPTPKVTVREPSALRDALSPSSPIFRHAVRVTIAVAAAAGAGAWISPHRVAWVSITTVAVLQPYTGLTVKLAAERVVGTGLGCLLVVGVAAATRSPLALALLMFPMSMAAVVTRPRSYRLFTFFVTPVFVLIALRSPGDWSTAALRVADALLGGAIAVAAALLIYPRWEERIGLPGALAEMLRAVEAYRDAVLAASPPRRPEGAARIVQARRAAGVSISEAETSLERRLAEPMRRGEDEERAMEQITFARRLAHAVTTLDMLRMSSAENDPSAVVERVRGFSELLRAASGPGGS
jgi:uncharacterized membrane protein YccC